MNLQYQRNKAKVKGFFRQPPPYTPLLKDGDSSPYFGNYEGQKYGFFDTFNCWNFSGCEVIETKLEMLWKLGFLSQDDKDWLIQYKYVDEDGDIYCSRQFVAILSGVRDNGNYAINFWNLVSEVGMIPNSMLPYSSKDAQKWMTQNQFNNEYFNENLITKEMELLGREFAKRFTIRAEQIEGGYFSNIQNILQMYLREGSIQIGVPVPHDGSWNRTNVDYPVGKFIPEHEVECYKISTGNYPIKIYDTYEPHLKGLSKDFYIPSIIRVVILPKAIAKVKLKNPSILEQIYQAVFDFFHLFVSSIRETKA